MSEKMVWVSGHYIQLVAGLVGIPCNCCGSTNTVTVVWDGEGEYGTEFANQCGDCNNAELLK